MTEFMKTYKLKITVLSPIHIGDSTDLEPTEYVIYSGKEASKPEQQKEESVIICPECGYKNPAGSTYCGDCGEDLPRQPLSAKKTERAIEPDSYLYTFTPGQLSDTLSPAEKTLLLKVANEGELTALQNFFKSKAAAIVKTATKRAFVCREFAKKYEEKFGTVSSKNNDFARFNIEKQISDAVTGLPYIPGSSIKGAIRTALMSAKNERMRLNKEVYKKGTDAEKTLYNYKDQSEDPFKALKIEDGLASESFITSIDTAENVKRNSGKILDQKGVSTYIEVIPSGTVFESSLLIMQNEAFCEDMSSIQKACNDFYTDILSDQEDRQVHTHGISADLFEQIRKITAKPQAFLLCLGKHGGAESKTIDDMRKIKIMQGKDKPARFDDHATTYWFANDGKERSPFGWCVVEFEEVK